MRQRRLQSEVLTWQGLHSRVSSTAMEQQEPAASAPQVW
jgi:hypothetical protein